MVARWARVWVAAWVAVERRHCTSARCGHCSTCASDQMLRRIIPTAERTVTRGGNKTIDKGDAIRERLPLLGIDAPIRSTSAIRCSIP